MIGCDIMNNNDVSTILNTMAIVCSLALGRHVDIDELDSLYDNNPICRKELDYILNG